MAYYAADGAFVSLVTCTLGEEGEVLVPELEHLGAAHLDELGRHRITELADSMVDLGVTDWRILGEPGKYRDSGMMGLETNKRDNCFWQADLLDAATDLVPVIRATRPHVLITYDDFGGYGHPDHIQAHRVAMYASMLAAAPSFQPDLGEAWDIPKVYWTALPKSTLRKGILAARESDPDSDIAQMDPDNIPFGIADDVITTRIDASAHVDQKLAAMRDYPSQINMQSGFFSFAESAGPDFGVEYFRLVKGNKGTVDATGLETDLFASL